jgi:MmyB-like transcription regulator ligand binding domain
VGDTEIEGAVDGADRLGVQQLLDAMDNVPAFVQNGRLDVIAVNRLVQAVFSEMYIQPQRPANFGRFVFLDPRAQTFYRDWADAAQQTVALLRTEAGRAPHDRALTDLVGQLSTRSDAFRTLWASHDVRDHRTGIKIIRHPVVGDLDLSYEAMGAHLRPGTPLHGLHGRSWFAIR